WQELNTFRLTGERNYMYRTTRQLPRIRSMKEIDMTTEQKPIAIRRVVTGHSESGRSIIAQDGVSTFTLTEPSIPGLVVTDLWKTFGTPADNADDQEPCSDTVTLTPPTNGSVF